MLLIIITFVLFGVTGAEDSYNEISSNGIVEQSSTEKVIESRDFIETSTTVTPRPNASARSRGSRYLRQTLRAPRRPPYNSQPYNGRRPNNNLSNLYGPQNWFKPTGGSYRPDPSKFRYQHHKGNWRQRWPDDNAPYYVEEEMEVEPPYDEYDDMDEYKNEDSWYTNNKNYRDRDIYDDVVSVSSKRIPTRYTSPGADYPRHRPRTTRYDRYESSYKDPPSWQQEPRNRFTRNYRDFIEMSRPVLKEFSDEDAFVGHRFKFSHPGSRYKYFDEEEYDLLDHPSLKNRRFRTESAQPAINVMQIRRPIVGESRFEHDYTDISKYVTSLQNVLPTKITTEDAVYSSKYRDHKSNTEQEERSKLKLDAINAVDETQPTASHEWKPSLKQEQQHTSDFLNQFMPSNRGQHLGYNTNKEVTGSQHNYKVNSFLPSEIIAYTSPAAAEHSAVVGKEQRYSHAAHPLIEKLADHDILKSTYSRKMSPVIDQDLEITFDERSVVDWEH